MTDAPTTAPPLLSRDEIEELATWAGDLIGSPTFAEQVITSLRAAYDPSGKPWSERAREAEETKIELAKHLDGTVSVAADAVMRANAAEAQIASLHRALAEERERAIAAVRSVTVYTSADAHYDQGMAYGLHCAEEVVAALPSPDLSSSCPRCETMRKALRPFANDAERLRNYPDDYPYGFPITPITVGDFRRARAALQEQQ
jgi:hypothetical protein